MKDVGLQTGELSRKAEDVAIEMISAKPLPMEEAENIGFEDLFDMSDIQRIQDDFSAATGVASIITNVDGTPITRPSNFCRLCSTIIRKTELGYANCCKSDAILGKICTGGPRIQLCLSGGLWDAGASIEVGGRHIANWLIGQVRDETQTDAKMLEYAKEIGAERAAFLGAFKEVPAMSREKFEKVANALYTFANQLSTLAYQNVQKARLVSERNQVSEALRLANEELELKVEERTQEIAAANEELTAQNEEITAMNEEILRLNQDLTRMNEELERRVAERTIELTATHQELSAQYEELEQSQESLQRSAAMQAVLREIAESALSAVSIEELCAKVHQSVQQVLPAKNFYIDFFDELTGQLVFPYCVDETNTIPREGRAPGKGLSEYVISQRRAVYVTPAELARLRESGEVLVRLVNYTKWAGAPLIDSTGKAFGVVALFLVTEEEQKLHQEDLAVLSILAAQVSMAIERKRTEKAFAESEARYRAILEQAPEAVLLCNSDTNEIIEANSRFRERFGYDLRRDGPLNMFGLIVDSPVHVGELLQQVKQIGFSPVKRRILRHKNGSLVSVELSATMVLYQGRSLFVMTLRDVSDEVRREHEIRRDAQMARRVQNALLSVPEPSEHLEIVAIYEPFGYVGGDLYFLDWRYDRSLLRGFLIDATGHGLGTALHTASLHVLLREVNELDLPLSDAMRWLNRRSGEYFDEGTFAGAQSFELDLQTRQLRWSCAGIPKMWLAVKTQLGAVECPGMSLGIRDDETFDTRTLSINVGDSLYFMTDGLADLLEGQSELPLNRYTEMVDLLLTLAKSENRRDDATAVCIKVRTLPQSLVRQDGWPRTLRFSGYGDYQRFKDEVTKILAEVTGTVHSFHEVVVNEALANAMECRDGVPRQHNARLRINKVGNRLIVRVKTSRIGFAGNAILQRLRSQPDDMFSFGEEAAMGRGIPMMLSMSHVMTYNNDGTEVLLAWKL